MTNFRRIDITASRNIGLGLIIALTTCALPSCSKQQATDDSDTAGDRKLNVFTVNYPLAYFAKEIGGELIEVHFPVPADIDPAFWAPEPEEVAKFQEADLILLNGAGYAKWTQHVSLPDSKLLDTTATAKEEYLQVEGLILHQHGPEGDHTHEGIAFTTWLDFEIAKTQASSIHKTLKKLRPGEAETLEKRFLTLSDKLDSLDQELQSLDSKQFPLFASQPVYQYLAKRYGLNIQGVHWEPDAVPSEAAWKRLAILLKQHPAKVMLWEASPLPEVQEGLGELGLRCVVFSPLGNTPADGDFISMMHNNIKQLSAAIK
ncbi:MAG: metal ABC transporter substrate-binding protein [Planctomycetota bacterium]|nr:metal ABC transporter substrate-binding protein [Planctomycetota bacterium]